MERNRLRGLIWFLGILIIAAIAIGTWYTLLGTSSPKELFPLNESSSSIILLSPEDRDTFPADASIPILVSAITEKPLSAIELWVEGELVISNQPAEEEDLHYAQYFHWTPAREGNVRILARSINTDGQITTSNPILLHISAPAGARLISLDENGDPASELILSLGGEPNSLPPNPDLPQAPVQNLPQAELMNDSPLLWLRSKVSINTVPPQAPELAYSVNECEATLVVTDRSDNELGFFIYRSGAVSYTHLRAHET